MHQLGGERRCWTVCVTILRSSDWNAHIPDVPPMGYEPPPADGIPHPLFGDGLTAEQMYQAQLHNWLAQNAAPNQNNEEVQLQGNDVHFQANWGAWPPSPPPAVYNYQAWLAAEGLHVQDGILPANNLHDSPSMA